MRGRDQTYQPRQAPRRRGVNSGLGLVVLLAAGLVSRTGHADQPTADSLAAWQKVAVKEDLIGDGRHHSVTTLRDRIAKIADGQIVVEAEQAMLIPPEDPVPERPAGITRAGSVRITATAKIADLDLAHIDVVSNSDLPAEDRIRGSGRGRYIVMPCLNDAKCWQLSSVQTTDTAPGEPDNQHQEKPFIDDVARNMLPTFWADASTAEQAKDLLLTSLRKATASAQ